MKNDDKKTFHGGVDEIGGNKILVEDGDSKIFLDFGKNFGQDGVYFNSPYIVAREESDLLEFGILPNIKGLYKKDGNECDVDAIFLSHAHMDHYDSRLRCHIEKAQQEEKFKDCAYLLIDAICM